MLRLLILLGAAPAGLLTGLAAWLAAGGPAAGAATMEPAAGRLATLKLSPAAVADGRYYSVGDLVARPVFALTSGPGAVTEPAIRLEGVSLSRGRAAALISLDGQPAEWIEVGSSRGGVSLVDVQGGAVVVETLVGTKTISLGEAAAATSGASAAAATVQPAQYDQIPAGFRSPPPPASAPH